MSAAPACLGCSALEREDLPRVTLLDGREATTWCACWREETRKRHEQVLQVLKLPDKAARLRYIASVGETFGELAAERLRAEVLAEWERRRAALAAQVAEAQSA